MIRDAIKINCDECGRGITRNKKRALLTNKHNFCSDKCKNSYYYHDNQRVKRARKRQIQLDKTERKRPTEISVCYLKEARAMLHGKHWKGKNRCVKLKGDE